jgi:hypothetical protein
VITALVAATAVLVSPVRLPHWPESDEVLDQYTSIGVR